VTPWEPPTTLVYYNSPTKTQLDIEQAATSVTNVLTSMVLEMEEAMRALGKRKLKDLSPEDLVALDEVTAKVTGVKLAYGYDQWPNSRSKECQPTVQKYEEMVQQLTAETLRLQQELGQLYKTIKDREKTDHP
jgi:hypothetical protein